MLKLMRLTLLLALMSLVLVACDSGGGDAGNGGQTTTALSETLETVDPGTGLNVKLNHPSGWAADTEFQITLASSAATLEKVGGLDEPELDADEQVVLVLPLPAEMGDLVGSPAEALDMMSAFLAGEGEVGDPQEVTLGAHSGVRAAITPADGPSGSLYMMQVGDNLVAIAFLAGSGVNNSTVEAIIASLEISGG